MAGTIQFNQPTRLHIIKKPVAASDRRWKLEFSTPNGHMGVGTTIFCNQTRNWAGKEPIKAWISTFDQHDMPVQFLRRVCL